MANPGRTLTTEEAAERLACSIYTVARMARSGELPHVRRVGNGPRAAYLFDEAVVDELAERRLARYRRAVEAQRPYVTAG